jgi:hypothetical protein
VIVCGLLEREPAKAVEHARQDHGERIEHEVFADVCGLVAAEREGGFACGHALIERCGAHADERKELVPGEEGEQGPLERTNAMGVELYELAEEISKAGESLETGDTKTNARIDGIEKSVDALFRRVNRPGAEGAANDNEVLLRKDAIGLCRTRRALTIPKIDAGVSDDYEPSPSEIDEALTARKAIRALWRHGDQNRLPLEFRKSLSNFSYGLQRVHFASAVSCRGAVMPGRSDRSWNGRRA